MTFNYTPQFETFFATFQFIQFNGIDFIWGTLLALLITLMVSTQWYHIKITTLPTILLLIGTGIYVHPLITIIAAIMFTITALDFKLLTQTAEAISMATKATVTVATQTGKLYQTTKKLGSYTAAKAILGGNKQYIEDKQREWATLGAIPLEDAKLYKELNTKADRDAWDRQIQATNKLYSEEQTRKSMKETQQASNKRQAEFFIDMEKLQTRKEKENKQVQQNIIETQIHKETENRKAARKYRKTLAVHTDMNALRSTQISLATKARYEPNPIKKKKYLEELDIIEEKIKGFIPK